MSALGGIVDSALGAIGGGSKGTTLQDFLANFSSSEGIWAKTIDPFSTFDVSMKFYPSKPWPAPGAKEDKSWASKLGDSLVTSAKGAV